MNYKTYLLTAACVTTLAISNNVSAAPKKAASPSPSASAAASPSPKASASPAAAATEAKPGRALPFRGTATAVDQSAKTFTVAGKETSRVFKASDQTKITKAGAAATFAELMDNEAVTGSYWKHEDGTMELKSLKIGGKTDAEKSGSSKKSMKGDDAAGADSAAAASPSPSASPKKK